MIITNNPLVKERLPKETNIVYMKCSYKDILIKVRDLCYTGYILKTHPLSGSVKPNETPYKSIMVSDASLGKTDFPSCELISNAISTYEKFAKLPDRWPKEVLLDFQAVDLSLMQNALKSIDL